MDSISTGIWNQTLNNILERVSQINMFSTRYDRDTKGSSGQFYHLSKVGTFALGLETYLSVPRLGGKRITKA